MLDCTRTLQTDYYCEVVGRNRERMMSRKADSIFYEIRIINWGGFLVRNFVMQMEM
jgi:hypothetical protein